MRSFSRTIVYARLRFPDLQKKVTIYNICWTLPFSSRFSLKIIAHTNIQQLLAVIWYEGRPGGSYHPLRKWLQFLLSPFSSHCICALYTRLLLRPPTPNSCENPLWNVGSFPMSSYVLAIINDDKFWHTLRQFIPYTDCRIEYVYITTVYQTDDIWDVIEKFRNRNIVVLYTNGIGSKYSITFSAFF